MTKHEQCLELLRSGNADNLSNPEIAAQVGCNEGTVRRAKAILEAERLTDRALDRENPNPGETESDRLLREIIEADRAEELATQALEEAREEVKELKEKLKEFVGRRLVAGRAARESFPLFDRPTNVSEPAREEGQKQEMDQGNPVRLAAMA